MPHRVRNVSCCITVAPGAHKRYGCTSCIVFRMFIFFYHCKAIFHITTKATCNNSSFVPQDFGKGRTLTSRCDFRQNLQRRGCESNYIEYPTSSISVLRNMPLSSKGSSVTRFTDEMIQIMPQDLSLKLRPGESSRRSEKCEPNMGNC